MSQLENILQVLTDHVRFLFTTLACGAVGNMQELVTTDGELTY